MTSAALRSRKARLDALFDKVKEIGDIELQAHWARYLCVLVSGFLETAVETVYGDYVQARADGRTASYARNRLARPTNLKMTRILQLSRRFDANWANKLASDTAGARKDAVDSIVNNRNQIAHGDDVGISYVRVRDYYERVIEVVELIDRQCR